MFTTAFRTRCHISLSPASKCPGRPELPKRCTVDSAAFRPMYGRPTVTMQLSDSPAVADPASTSKGCPISLHSHGADTELPVFCAIAHRLLFHLVCHNCLPADKWSTSAHGPFAGRPGDEPESHKLFLRRFSVISRDRPLFYRGDDPIIIRCLDIIRMLIAERRQNRGNLVLL